MTTESFPQPAEPRNGGFLKYILLGLLLIVLYASNPSLQDHKEAVSKKLTHLLRRDVGMDEQNESITSQAGTEIGFMFGSAILSKLVDEIVERKNFLFFSITTVNYEGDDKIIGIGIFGNVFISDKIEKSFEDAKDKLRSALGGVNNTTTPENNDNGQQPEKASMNDTANEQLFDTAGARSDTSAAGRQLGQNKITSYYIVNASESEHVHFFNKPDYSTVRKAYFAEPDTVIALNIENGFAYVEFTNSQNQTSKGWVPLSNMALLNAN